MSRPAAPGIGDRWLAGYAIEGVAFGPGASVEFVRGPRMGARATVLLLVSVATEPTYRVRAASGDELHVRQSALRAIGATTAGGASGV